MQTVGALFWLAIILRLLLLAAASPGLLMNAWLSMHLGCSLPVGALEGLSVTGVFGVFFWSTKRIRELLESEPQKARRAFLSGTVATTFSILAMARGTHRVEVSHFDLPLRDLADSLEGLRLVVLSDLHRGPAVSNGYLRSVIAKVNHLQPDIVALPGDFVSKSPSYFLDIAELLSSLKPRIATFATLGNHDHWESAELASEALKRAGVILLHNRCVHLNGERGMEGESDAALCFVGVDDLWAGRPDLEAALEGSVQGVPRILLSHNPDFAEEQAALALRERIDVQFSGHTHGGQVVLPGIGPVAMGSRYGLKYLAGFAQGPGWPVFVTRGIGTSSLPVRVGADPEIAVFTLQRDASRTLL